MLLPASGGPMSTGHLFFFTVLIILILVLLSILNFYVFHFHFILIYINILSCFITSSGAMSNKYLFYYFSFIYFFNFPLIHFF